MMAEAFSLTERGLRMFEQQDPNIQMFSKVSAGVNDDILCYNLIYGEQKKKTHCKLPWTNSSDHAFYLKSLRRRNQH